MSFGVISNNYAVAVGTSTDNVAVPFYALVNPTSTNVGFPIGKRWVNTAGNTVYSLTSYTPSAGALVANWQADAGGSILVSTLTGDSGGPISPVLGNINLLGTALEISTVGSGNTITFSIPPTFSIGSTSGTNTATILGGTSITLDGAVGTAIGIGASLVAGTIVIGGTGQTGTLTLGSSSGTNTVIVGGGAGATTVNIATGATNAKTVNIGTGAITGNAVTIGSGTGTGAVTINAGLGLVQVGSALQGTSTITGATFYATADAGGVVSQNAMSNINSTTISTGVGTIHMSTGNVATNTGWIKFYIGTQVAWVPTWTTNAP